MLKEPLGNTTVKVSPFDKTPCITIGFCNLRSYIIGLEVSRC